MKSSDTHKRGRGRPKLPNKKIIYSYCLSKDVAQAITDYTQKHGMTKSEFIERATFHFVSTYT